MVKRVPPFFISGSARWAIRMKVQHDTTLLWVDRGGSGTVPLFSSLLVAALLILSVVLFSRLIQRVNDLQITNVLHSIGNSEPSGHPRDLSKTRRKNRGTGRNAAPEAHGPSLRL
jgi:hypothetical protein